MIFFETSNYDNKANFRKWSFVVKPKWFHGGFKFMKPPLPKSGFKRFWRFFGITMVWVHNSANLLPMYGIFLEVCIANL